MQEFFPLPPRVKGASLPLRRSPQVMIPNSSDYPRKGCLGKGGGGGRQSWPTTFGYADFDWTYQAQDVPRQEVFEFMD